MEDHEDRAGRLGTVQSLVRALGLLDMLTKHQDGLTLSEIAKLVALPRSTAHRLLTTMDAMRYVEFEQATNRWLIGVQAFALGTSFVERRDLGRLGRPIMRMLMLEANELVNISISDTKALRFVGQVKPMAAQQARVAPGTHAPLHATAAGKALMAHWSSFELDTFLRSCELTRRTGWTIVDKAALVGQLDSIRAQGFAIDDQEHLPGWRCVAAPVFDRHGRAKASLSISGDIRRLGNDRLHALGSTLAMAARRMTDDVGGVLAA